MKMMKKGMGIATAALLLFAGSLAANAAEYEITITNITKGQTFTPILGVAHKSDVALFELGQPAAPELADLAESGDVGPLAAIAGTVPDLVGGYSVSPGLLAPGASATFTLEAPRGFNRLSLAAMLIPTNDTFVAVDSLRLPSHGERQTFGLAYDAGSEFNDQNCNNIPGPRCGGEGNSAPADDDEGHVSVSNGFHDLPQSVSGEVLGPFTYDWRNPVAQVTVRRIAP